MRKRFCLTSTVFVIALFLSNVARADVSLPAVFGDGMVLQRGQPVPIWGWAGRDEQVTVSFRDQKVSTKAGGRGIWKVTLQPLEIGEPATLTVTGANTLTIEDVLVGEVWFCSGQSNMEWPVSSVQDADLEISSAQDPQVRLLHVPRNVDIMPQVNADVKWVVCSPQSVRRFSAVGYLFGRELRAALGVPVGLINASWGGTPAESWVTPDALADAKDLQPIIEYWRQRKAKYDPEKVQQEYEAALAKWDARVKEVGKENAGRQPQMEVYPNQNPHFPSSLYNGMVSPIAPYAIRGVIWYQGESNASRAYQYRKLMPTLIQSWRDAWRQGDFPFLQVQLANYKEIKTDPGDSDWAELREAQWLTTRALPHVGAICATDIGAAKDIHPRDKQTVAKRLARMALHDDYGMDTIIPRGPVFQELSIDGQNAILKFETYGSPLTSYYKEPLTGFAIAGADRKWVWGQAVVTGPDTVTISHPDVPEPVAVRYNWADNPQGNLYSDALLPAYPFRTDDWEGLTAHVTTP